MPFLKLPGVHLPHRKSTAGMAEVRMETPASVTLPMSMHIGTPATPVVKAGDRVAIGQVIGAATGPVSVPIHSSVSGTVKKVDAIRMPGGALTPAVVIESDGENRIFEGIRPPEVNDFASFIAAVRDSGSVGLGGAGFPTAVKLNVRDRSALRALIINAAECEPYITSDTRTMVEHTDDLFEGIGLLKKWLAPPRIVIGVERNKAEAIARLRPRCAEAGIELRVLPAVYPQGAEKVLIYHTIGAVVPEGKLPLDVGAVVLNCTTAAFLAHYFRTGMPLVERCITVDGGAVREPKNLVVPVGCAAQDVFDAAGGFLVEPAKVLYGGPMMGTALSDLQMPVLKNTNALLALTAVEAKLPPETACIRCGRCINHCPLHLSPVDIARALKSGNVEAMEAAKAQLCMECGCCSYGCPAGKRLVQQNKLAKAQVRQYLAKKREEADRS